MLYLDCWKLQNCSDKHLRYALVRVVDPPVCRRMQITFNEYFTFHALQQVPLTILQDRCLANPDLPLTSLLNWFGISVIRLAAHPENAGPWIDGVLPHDYVPCRLSYHWLGAFPPKCINAYLPQKNEHCFLFVLTEEMHPAYGLMIQAIPECRIDWST